MKIKKQLAEFKQAFDQRLERFLIKEENRVKKLASAYSEAIKEIRRLNRAGGKRLRPFFIWLGFKACSGENNNLAWQACLSMELNQAFALIHDDIMDNACLRRGKKTCFQKIGLNKAILVGDTALVLAQKTIPLKAKACFDLMTLEMIGGQYLDIDGEWRKSLEGCRRHPSGLGGWQTEFFLKEKFSEKQVLKIMELKSAQYTVARPLQIGGILAGADKKTLAAFLNYGRNLGVAFQIQDDILGLFGKEKKIGKPIGLDISEGKKTLLIAKLLQVKNLNSKVKNYRAKLKILKNYFGTGKDLTKKDLLIIRALIKESKVLADCQTVSVKLTQQAKEVIKNVKIRKKEKEILLAITDYIINRKG